MSTTRFADPPAPATEAAVAAVVAARRGGRWCDAALVLIGHGSTECADARAATLRHAAALRRRGLFAAVTAGFVKGGPGMRAAIDGVAAAEIYIVPCFMADGYFARTEIPRALALEGPVTMQSVAGRAAAPPRRLNYCAPLGTSPRLEAMIGRRVIHVCHDRGLAPAATTVVLAGHGTPRDGASSETAYRAAAALAARRRFAGVRVGFLEEPPFIADALDGSGGGPVVAVGLMAAEGLHGDRDIPDAIAACRRGRPVHYAGAIGAAPGAAAAILERVMAFDRGER